MAKRHSSPDISCELSYSVPESLSTTEKKRREKSCDNHGLFSKRREKRKKKEIGCVLMHVKRLHEQKIAKIRQKSDKKDVNKRFARSYNESRKQQLQIWPNPEALGNGGPNQ
jgi:hypothetical protein